MRILVASDLVVDSLYNSHVHDRIGEVDLVLGCGDLPFYFLEFLVDALDAPTLYVRGNHDPGFEYTSEDEIRVAAQGALDIDTKTVMVGGVLVGGLEGSIRYNRSPGAQYTQNEMWLKFLQMIPRLWLNRQRYGRAVDIFISHSPPFGIHDGPDFPHTGFKALLALMRWFRPRYLLHGHKHVYDRLTASQTRYCDTEVINVYPFRFIEWPAPRKER